MVDIEKIMRVSKGSKVELPEILEFGKVFTPHIFEMRYDGQSQKWSDPVIRVNSDVRLGSAASVFHYGQSIYEGLKAYLQPDGSIALFRPKENAARFNRSASRLCMPEVDPDIFLNGIKQLVELDKDWLPDRLGHSLYIRPVMFASEPALGVRPSNDYVFIIMLCPVGPYYLEGFKPVPIMVTDKYSRATVLGVGDVKAAGNYAAGMAAQAEAKKEGYAQVLWLDAKEQKYIEEVGMMNVFVVFKDQIATPRLSGSILPGVTRQSIIELLANYGYNIVERDISIDEILSAYDEENLIEIFGTGTAAVISSLSRLKYKDKIIKFDENKPGAMAQLLYDNLTGIQTGKFTDEFNWVERI